MKNLIFNLSFCLMVAYLHSNGQQTEKFDIVGYTIPSNWVKDVGNDFVAYTINDNASSDYARIFLFSSMPGTGNVNADFDIEWKELVQLNYNPGSFTNTNVSDYKDGWVSKIGIAPFKFQNANHVALLLTQVKAQTKMSFLFITNTTKYQSVFEDFGNSLVFGGGQSISTQQNKPMRNETQASNQFVNSQYQQPIQPATAQASGFQYTTSNFDDGWTATIQKDWVLVEKNNARVYLYFAIPYNSDNFTGTGVMDRDFYWDNYVARQFKISVKQYRDGDEFIGSLKPKYVEGFGTDPETGASRFIAMTLTVSPNTAHISIASFPDEVSFRQTLPNANGKYSSDLTDMTRYNKFAIGPNDILGTWQNGNTSTMQWAYETPSGYEGYAGMTVASSSATFNFNARGAYTSIHNGATGAVGNMSTFQQEYKGTYTVSNWEITATNRYGGKTDNFEASFMAIRGGRVLHLNNGAGQEYNLVKVK